MSSPSPLHSFGQHRQHWLPAILLAEYHHIIHHWHDNPCLPASPPARQPVPACITTGMTTRVCLHHHRHDNPCLPASPLARQPVSACITTGTTTRVCLHHHWHDNPCLPASPPARQPVSACITVGKTTRVCPLHHRPDNSCHLAPPPAPHLIPPAPPSCVVELLLMRSPASGVFHVRSSAPPVLAHYSLHRHHRIYTGRGYDPLHTKGNEMITAPPLFFFFF